MRGIRKKGGKKSFGEGVLGPESLVAQGVEGSDERMGFSEILRDARRGVDTVLVFFWKHQIPEVWLGYLLAVASSC